MPTMWTDWIAGIAQVLCSWMNTLGDVLASHRAKFFIMPCVHPSRTLKSEPLVSETRSSDERVARHGIAVLSRFRQLGLVGGRINRALGERADARPEVGAVPEWIDLDAEHRTGRERGTGDPLRSDGGGAGHLDAP